MNRPWAEPLTPAEVGAWCDIAVEEGWVLGPMEQLLKHSRETLTQALMGEAVTQKAVDTALILLDFDVDS